MANTPQQTTGIAQEFSYAYQGAGGQWVMTKEEFEGHKGFLLLEMVVLEHSGKFHFL